MYSEMIGDIRGNAAKGGSRRGEWGLEKRDSQRQGDDQRHTDRQWADADSYIS